MPSRFSIKETDRMVNSMYKKKLSEKDLIKLTETLSHLVDPKAYSERHEKFENIFLLNGYKEPKYLYKYITYSSFVQYIEKNILVFVSPILWPDPFEYRFLNTDYTAYNYNRPEIACMCTTENTQENEDAAWKIYINNQKEKGLRISLNTENLLSQLNELAKERSFKIYIGKMIYDFGRNEIEELHTDKFPSFKEQFFTFPFTNDNYLSLMCLKRVSFQYESEIRIFLVKEIGLYETSKNTISIPLDIKSIIKRVVIAPLPPYDYLDPRQSEYKQYDELERKSFYRKIKKILPSCEVYSSTLYKCDLLEKA
jgi:hypothetical protein